MSEGKEEPRSQRTAACGVNLARQAIAALGGGVGTSGSQNAVASGSGTQNGRTSSSGAQGLAADPKGGITPSRTTVLFPHRTSFSTADEFFAECSTRLRSQYGYPANPSKRKDDKVRVRCFCHKLSGCPFRVCALKQQDGSWFVQNKASSTLPFVLVAPAAAPPIPVISRDPEVAAADAAKAPSPAAQQQQLVAPPQKDNIIDLTLESDDEVDTKEHLQLPQVLNGRPAPKPGYRTFVEGEPILWTLETDVQGMKNLVKDREDIFAKQRKVNADPNLEREGLQRAQAFLKNNGDPRVTNAFEAYLRFCQRCDTCPFPMTNAMLALCLFAKSSRADKGHASFRRELTRVQGAIRGLFDRVDGYEDLEQLEPFALDDFVRERDQLRMSNDDRLKKDATNPAVPASRVREHTEDSSDDEDVTDSDSEDDGDNWSADEHAEPNVLGNTELDSYATKVKEQLPTSRDAFETLDDLFGQVVGVVVPVYGISVFKSNCSSGSGGIRCNRSVGHWDGTPVGHCPFRLQVMKVGGDWFVDESRSTYSHSHGPTRGILNNPNWLPKIKNPVARKVMGLPTLPSSTSRENGKVKHRSTAASPILKKRKHDQCDASGKFKAQKQQKEEKRDVPAAAKPVHFEAHFLGQPVEQQPPVGQYFEPFQLPLPTPAVVVPAAAAFVQPATSSGFIPALQSILGIWNGRLVPLAPALIAAGISSWADLGGLFHMPQVALNATLAAVRDHAIPAQGSSADAQYWDGLVSLLADKIKEEGRR